MGRLVNLEGRRFGNLIVGSRAPNRGKHVMWHCWCDCGGATIVRGNNLKTGNTTSCGCGHKSAVTKHGGWNTPEYNSYRAMLERCLNVNHPHYNNYGGRGITVCAKWRDSFPDFLEDMGARPSGTTLDRIDNDGDYTPTNCQWSTNKEQALNRRRNPWYDRGRSAV